MKSAHTPQLTRESIADPRDAVMASAASVIHRFAISADIDISITDWLDLVLAPAEIKHHMDTFLKVKINFKYKHFFNYIQTNDNNND